MKNFYTIISNKPFKIFYNGLVPKSIRCRWRYQFSWRDPQTKVGSYWDEVINNYKNNSIAKYNVEPSKKDLVGKKIIWQYWGQGFNNLPDVVKLCFDSIDFHAKDYTIIRLTDSNLEEYIELPDFVKNKRTNSEFKSAFFSDLLRVALLSAYGGVWLDATIYLTDSLPVKYEDYDFFMYSRDPNSGNKLWGKNDSDYYFNWRDEFKIKYLNSIIFSKPYSLTVKIWTDLLLFFWKTETKIDHYFFCQIMMNQLKISQLIKYDFPIVDDTLPHLLQRCMDKPYNKKNFKEITSSVSMHKLTLHKKFKEEVSSKQTYYGYLKNLNN